MSTGKHPVSMLEFIRTGAFGPITCGMYGTEIRATLGAPDDFGLLPAEETHSWTHFPDETVKHKPPSTSPRLEHALLWKYGDIEFHFDRTFRRLHLIFTDTFDVPQGGERIELDPWIMRKGLPEQTLEHALTAAAIPYHYTKAPDPSHCTQITLASGVELLFVRVSLTEEERRGCDPPGLCAVSYMERGWFSP